MTPPFTDADVLFRFVPTEDEQLENDWREEYVLVSSNVHALRFVALGRVGSNWFLMPDCLGVVIARLLTDRTKLLAACGEWDAMANRLMAERDDRDRAYRTMYDLYHKALAERDVYKAALETIASLYGQPSQAEARDALAQGAKIREGK